MSPKSGPPGAEAVIGEQMKISFEKNYVGANRYCDAPAALLQARSHDSLEVQTFEKRYDA